MLSFYPSSRVADWMLNPALGASSLLTLYNLAVEHNVVNYIGLPLKYGCCLKCWKISTLEFVDIQSLTILQLKQIYKIPKFTFAVWLLLKVQDINTRVY